MVNEVWADINGHPGYTVSNFGRIRNERLNKFLYPHYSEGYKQVPLSTNKIKYVKKVHRLVANAFIPNPDNKPLINHKDKVRDNNKVSNLEWVTYKENSQHAHNSSGLSRSGKRLLKIKMLYLVNKLVPF
jgi:hypothetical protein